MKNGLLISSAGVGVFIALAPSQVLPCIESGHFFVPHKVSSVCSDEPVCGQEDDLLQVDEAVADWWRGDVCSYVILQPGGGDPGEVEEVYGSSKEFVG